MSDKNIVCPYCSKEIALTETLSLQIKNELQAEFETKQKEQNELLVELQKKLDVEKVQLNKERESIQQSVEEKLKVEKERLWKLAQEKAEEKSSLELADLKLQKEERERQLQEAQKNELDLRAKTRELEEKSKLMDLELQRKLDEERKKIEETLKEQQSGQLEERLRTIQEDFRRKELEKDKQMEMLKRSLDEAQRKSEQASMQIQGEVQEQDLKQLLNSNFPIDGVDDVPTGIRGADLVQTVTTQYGQKSGIILWECKNRKQWSDDWIKKLKGDQGLVNADVCVLVSTILPDHIQKFGNIDGIWVIDFAYVIPVTVMLRSHLIQLYQAKNSVIGQEGKKDYLYQYISSPQFKNRLENIIMGFSSLKEDLESEKRAMQRIWSKREKEIERVVMNTTGMYGDVQGIIGASLPTVPILELEPEKLELEEDIIA